MEFRVAGGEFQRGLGHPLRCVDGSKVGLQGIVRIGGRLVLQRHGGSGEPEVKRRVGLGHRESGEAFGQAQGRAVKAGARRRLGPGAEFAQEGKPVVRGFLGHRLDFHGGVTAKPAEEDCQPSAHLGKQDTGSVVDRVAVQTTGKGVPQFPDGFFGFPWLEVDP